MLSYTKSRLAGKTLILTLFFFLLVTQICFAQWFQQNSGTNKNLYAVQFTDANNGFAVGDSGIILRTTNAGNNWLIQPSETTMPLRDIFFVDEINGWIGGGKESGGWLLGIILRTTDGGTTWFKQSEDSSDVYSNIFFKGTENGWYVGWSASWKTTDGGINWTMLLGMFYDFRYSDVIFKNAITGILVGAHLFGGERFIPKAAILRTLDGGINWYIEDLPGVSLHTELFGVCTADTNKVFAIGRSTALFPSFGIIAKTTDWGINWTTEIIEGPSFNDIYFVDEINGWVVGGTYYEPNNQGPVSIIRGTTDGGITWIFQMSDTLNVFNGVYCADVSNGWAVGDKGAIFHTTNGGVSFVEEEQLDERPTKFLLSQNYPNPFNPQTNIQYAVSVRQFISLKVYDVLGNEIETLVNEEKPAGSYELTWYAENLPSGVYFYQLRAGSFIQTRKMLLLK